MQKTAFIRGAVLCLILLATSAIASSADAASLVYSSVKVAPIKKVAFQISPTTANAGSPAILTIQRSVTSSGYNVNVVTTDGTAKAGVDYDAVSTTVNMAVGVSSVTVSVPTHINANAYGQTLSFNATLYVNGRAVNTANASIIEPAAPKPVISSPVVVSPTPTLAGVPMPTSGLSFGTACANSSCTYVGAVEVAQVTASCAQGTMTVSQAIYGVGSLTESCTTYVASVCNGLSSCTFDFSNNNCGGDPDPGTVKSGSLTISCSGSAPAPAPAPSPSSTPVVSPSPVASGSVTFDTAIGLGVDADGYAVLPLRVGAHRYFVNSSTGSDTNGCLVAQAPTTPLKTLAAGMNCVQNQEGDQVLLAEGTSYAESTGWLAFKQGYSAAYPMVIESYDPADPLNESKYGRGEQRNARPVLTANQSQVGNGTYSYIAIKGLDFNPGNVGDSSMLFVGKASYILIENNLFRYIGISFDTGDYPAFPTTPKLIVRNNSIYGMWSSTTSGHTGGLYVAGYVGPTVEDNVFYHCGWNIAISRDETNTTLGVPTVFNHSYYIQTNTTGAIVRRNLSTDGAGDGGIARGDSMFSENLFIDNPAAIGVGGGPEYNIDRPNGVTFDVGYNAIIGDADVTSAHPLGWGINTSNGQQGSRIHNNLIVRSRNPSSSEMSGFSNYAAFNQPSYAQYDHNLIWNWVAQSIQLNSYYAAGGAFPAQTFSTYDFNNWDGQAQGTNTNSTNTVFPNPYTALQMYNALGFSDKASFIDYAINHPEAHIQRAARALLFSGYGMQ